MDDAPPRLSPTADHPHAGGVLARRGDGEGPSRGLWSVRWEERLLVVDGRRCEGWGLDLTLQGEWESVLAEVWQTPTGYRWRLCDDGWLARTEDGLGGTAGDLYSAQERAAAFVRHELRSIVDELFAPAGRAEAP